MAGTSGYQSWNYRGNTSLMNMAEFLNQMFNQFESQRRYDTETSKADSRYAAEWNLKKQIDESNLETAKLNRRGQQVETELAEHRWDGGKTGNYYERSDNAALEGAEMQNKATWTNLTSDAEEKVSSAWRARMDKLERDGMTYATVAINDKQYDKLSPAEKQEKMKDIAYAWAHDQKNGYYTPNNYVKYGKYREDGIRDEELSFLAPSAKAPNGVGGWTFKPMNYMNSGATPVRQEVKGPSVADLSRVFQQMYPMGLSDNRYSSQMLAPSSSKSGRRTFFNTFSGM